MVDAAKAQERAIACIENREFERRPLVARANLLGHPLALAFDRGSNEDARQPRAQFGLRFDDRVADGLRVGQLDRADIHEVGCGAHLARHSQCGRKHSGRRPLGLWRPAGTAALGDGDVRSSPLFA